MEAKLKALSHHLGLSFKGVGVVIRVDPTQRQLLFELTDRQASTNKKRRMKRVTLSVKKSARYLEAMRQSDDLKSLTEPFADLLTDVNNTDIDLVARRILNYTIPDLILDSGRKVFNAHLDVFKATYLNPIQMEMAACPLSKPQIVSIWGKLGEDQTHGVSLTNVAEMGSVKTTYTSAGVVISSNYCTLTIPKNATTQTLLVPSYTPAAHCVINVSKVIASLFKQIMLVYDVSVLRATLLETAKICFSEDQALKKASQDTAFRPEIQSQLTLTVDPKHQTVQLGKGAKLKVKAHLGEVADTVQAQFDETLAKLIKLEKKRLKTIAKELKSLSSKEYAYPIVKVVTDSPKKGVTTYQAILKGDKTAKLRADGYDRLASYGALAHYSKPLIKECLEELIKAGLLNSGTFKASFGNYVGLTASSKGQNLLELGKLEKQVVPKEPIAFFEYFTMTRDANYQEALLENIPNLTRLGAEEVKALIDVIQGKRVHKAVQNRFSAHMAFKVPKKYKPLFELNLILTTGESHQMFQNLCDLI